MVKVTNIEGPVSSENLSNVEFKISCLSTYKFLGSPCVKLFRDKQCHELFAETNMQNTRTQYLASAKVKNCRDVMNVRITHVGAKQPSGVQPLQNRRHEMIRLCTWRT